jgi:hypothetical protein
VLLPAESIIEQTWGGSESPPAEWIDFALMRQMRWSWDQLQQTPLYVRRYCVDFLNMLNTHEEREAERERRKSERASGG